MSREQDFGRERRTRVMQADSAIFQGRALFPLNGLYTRDFTEVNETVTADKRVEEQSGEQVCDVRL